MGKQIARENLQITKASEDPDFLKCMDYLMWVEWDQKTQNSFAKKWNTTAVTVYRWKLKWIRNGLMADCREVIGLALFDDVKSANRKVVRRWTELSEAWVELAMTAQREDVKATVLRDLYTLIIQPEFEHQRPDGNPEAEYLDFIEGAAKALDPMSVSGVQDDPETEASTTDDIPELEAEDEDEDSLDIPTQ